MRRIVFFLTIFLIGIFYRLIIAKFFPQPLIWDQEQYYGYALGIIRSGLHADTVRLYGYPIFLVPFIMFFGDQFQWSFTVFQAFVDCGTGVIVYLLGKKIFFSDPRVAWVGYILYLANPFTSAYVGVLLTEIVAIFFVTLSIYLFTAIIADWKWRTAYFATFFLGYIPQIRPSFLYFTLIVAVAVCIIGWKKNRNWLNTSVLVILYCLPFAYTMTVNLYRYRQFSFQSVDNVFIREVYISLFVDRAAPPGDSSFTWPMEVYSAWFDFSSPTTPEGRSAMSDKYKKLALQKIQEKPVWFIKSRLLKAWYVWEKHYVFPYIQMNNEKTSRIIYIANSIILLLFVVGFLLWFGSKRVRENNIKKNIGFIILFLLFYISAAHVFSTSEERFSLPGYPFLFLFTGYSLVLIWSRLQTVWVKTNK